MDTKHKTPRLVRRTSVMLKEETRQALQDLADQRNDGMITREIRRALEEYVERETEAAA